MKAMIFAAGLGTRLKPLTDTVGGIKKADWLFDNNQPFLVLNVDILSNIDIPELY